MSFNNLCDLCKSSSFDKEYKECKDCRRFICIECKIKHYLCVECKENICCYKKICTNCDIHPYHMITDNIAVGSSASDYQNFDIIVNLNYPENNVSEDDIEISKSNGKLMYPYFFDASFASVVLSGNSS